MKPYLWLILLSVSFGVAGQTAMKLGVRQPGAGETANGIWSLLTMILRTPLIWLGIFFYAVGALAWIAVIARVDLSLAYPFLALNFVLVAFVSRVVLDEIVPTLRWIGICVICIGILFVALST